MIPTLLILGLGAGLLPRRWAIAGVVLLAGAWTAGLAANGTMGASDVVWATALGLANAATGALLGLAIRAAIRLTRDG